MNISCRSRYNGASK